MELLTNFFDRGSCINSFTETGKRPQPTRLQGTSTRSDRGPLDPGDLNTFTMEMKLPWILLKEFDSNNIKKGRGAISFANHSVLKKKYEMVLQKELL